MRDFETWLLEAAMGFGKYAQTDITEVPAGYLVWMVQNLDANRFEKQIGSARMELDRRRAAGTVGGGSRPSSQSQPQKQMPTQQQPQQQDPTKPPIQWVYAKVTQRGYKNLPLGKEIALNRISPDEWIYIVLDSSGPNVYGKNMNAGSISMADARNGAIESFKDLTTGKPMTTERPTLDDLNARLSGQPGAQQKPVAAKGKKTTIPDEMMSDEQRAIDEKFARLMAQGPGKSHLMLPAGAGSGKTTMLKHLAHKFGNQNQRWLYVVFNSKNKVEAKDQFPQFVDVRTSNGFLGEVLRDSHATMGQTKRVADLENYGKKSESKVEKIRLIADSPDFQRMMEKVGIPSNIDVYEYGRIGKTLDSIINNRGGIKYNFKETSIKIAELSKAYAFDPRHPEKVKEGVKWILENYDLDTTLKEVKERIQNYGGDFTKNLIHYLQEIFGFDFMTKDFKEELGQAAIWLLEQTLPGASKLSHKIGAQNFNMGEYRDFTDDLWYAATHPDKVNWPKYDIVLVDEAQDFNVAQRIMIENLINKGATVVVVGDEDQAIYRFRGADGDAFQNLGKLLSDRSVDKDTTYKLTKNFRSKKKILDFVADETGVRLQVGRKTEEGDEGVVTKYEKQYDEVFDEIGKERKQGVKVPTAFISRTNEPLVHAALRLLSQGVPFQILGKDIAKDLMTHIKRVSGKNRIGDFDDINVLRDGLEEFYTQQEDSFGHESTKKDYLKEMDETTKAIVACIDTFAREAQNDRRNAPTIANFRKWLFERLGGLNANDNEKDYEAYKKRMEKETPIVLTSAHRSKGMEYSRVYILRYDQFPSPKAKLAADKRQENNAKYVSLTRAEDELHIIDMEGQPGYKGSRPNDENEN